MKATSFVVDPVNLKRLEKIKEYVQEGFNDFTVESGLASRKMSRSDVLNYSIKTTYDLLVEKGLITEEKEG